MEDLFDSPSIGGQNTSQLSIHSYKEDLIHKHRGLWLLNAFSVTKDIDVPACGNTSCEDLNNISNLLDTGEQKG